MAQSKKQLDNLKRGNPSTQFVSGREAVEKGKKGRKARSEKRKRRMSMGEAAQAAAKVPLNEIGINALRRRGLDIDSVDPEDLQGVAALAMGQMIAGINGNSQAAQNFADWLDLATKHKKDQLEIEKLKAEIERIRRSSDPDQDDGVEIINDAPRQEYGQDLGHCDSEVPGDI